MFTRSEQPGDAAQSRSEQNSADTATATASFAPAGGSRLSEPLRTDAASTGNRAIHEGGAIAGVETRGAAAGHHASDHGCDLQTAVQTETANQEERIIDELLAEQLDSFGELVARVDNEVPAAGEDRRTRPWSTENQHPAANAQLSSSNFTDLLVDSETTVAANSGGISLNLLTQASPAPDWQLFTRFFDFLFECNSPEEIIHRAAAGLGLLPQVAWTDVDGQPSDEPGHECEFFGLPKVGPDGSQGRWLAVKLDDPHDKSAAAMVRGILSLVSRMYRRECRAEQLVDEAHTDPLTGLWNRRGFDATIERAVARASRQGERVSLVCVDVDHFKAINDVYGHAAGDEALVCIAKSIRSISRPCDLAVRTGGDEIAILLSGSDAHGAMQLSERLRQAVADANPLAPHPLQLSIGVVDTQSIGRFHSPAEGREKLLAAADEALYEAKAAGRNCSRCYEPRPGVAALR